MNAAARLAAVLILAAPAASFAQGRGRTDGPEGSEYGKGGYDSPGGGPVSLEVNWGASLQDKSTLRGVSQGSPLFVGVTASYWAYDWFLVDANADYLFDSQKINLLVGPRLRTQYFPLSFSVGLRAGAIVHKNDGVYFGISPQAGFDMLLGRRFLLGLGYAADIPVGIEGVAHRVFLNLGVRF